MALRFFGYQTPRMTMNINEEKLMAFAGEAVSIKNSSLREKNGKKIVDVTFININNADNLLTIQEVPLSCIENWEMSQVA